MSVVKMSNIFGSNHTTVSGGVGLGGAVAGAGAALAMIFFAVTVATFIGGALALAIVVLASTAAGCMLAGTGVVTYKAIHRVRLERAHWERFGQLPEPRGPVTVYLRRPPPPAQIEAPAARAAPWPADVRRAERTLFR